MWVLSAHRNVELLSCMVEVAPADAALSGWILQPSCAIVITVQKEAEAKREE